MLFPPHSTELLHLLLRQQISPGQLVIDATAGNGHDTTFLAQQVGPNGKVIAFDIQEKAITATREKLLAANLLDRVTLLQTSHTELLTHTPPQSASAIIFNLGYLPGTDHNLTTHTDSTLLALTAATQALQANGILAVTCYPGHPAGLLEADAVKDFFENLPHHRVALYTPIATKKPAPFLLIARSIR